MGCSDNNTNTCQLTPRRSFVKTCLLTAALAPVGSKEWFGPLLGEARADVLIPAGSLAINLSSFPALLSDNGSAYVQAPNQPNLIVIRLPGPRFYAVTSVCTHQGCTVGLYRASLGVLLCPCHGSEYNPDGTVVHGPAPLPLTNYPTQYDGVGALTIQLLRTAFEMKAALVRTSMGTPRMSFSFDTLVGNNYQVLFQATPNGTQWNPVSICQTVDGPANLSFYNGDGNPATVYADATAQAGYFMMARRKLLGA